MHRVEEARLELAEEARSGGLKVQTRDGRWRSARRRRGYYCSFMAWKRRHGGFERGKVKDRMRFCTRAVVDMCLGKFNYSDIAIRMMR
jgi:hypothetical protein